MPDVIMKSVQTQGVGFAPILRCYLDKCRIQQIIDENVPLDPRRKILSHGEASVAMITGILFQVLQLYSIYLHLDIDKKRHIQKKFIKYMQSVLADDSNIDDLLQWENEGDLMAWLDSL